MGKNIACAFYYGVIHGKKNSIRSAVRVNVCFREFRGDLFLMNRKISNPICYTAHLHRLFKATKTLAIIYQLFQVGQLMDDGTNLQWAVQHQG